ncbi:uncharacterized protein LOC113471671 [Diaphorina citri]|uniref:Uncharacterized protein LOC113471671 n=1 Tax=Diaphorina citri TaxID=121845 RepID=A0A3Q0JI70_DIACI|nr:uncharacterized protein LOC113471671 [Diaphorina citri]
MAVVQKRNFTRSKNELVKLKEVIEGVKAKSITDDNYEGAKTLFKVFTSKLKTYETRRNDLEAVAQDEDLDVLIPKESEDLYDYLYNFSVVERTDLKYKLSFADEFESLKKCFKPSTNLLKQLYYKRFPLKENKHKDLKSLIESKIIPTLLQKLL